MTKHLAESLEHDALVLPLASRVLRSEPELPTRVQTVPELLHKPFLVVLRNGRRVHEIERQLHLRRGLVDVLSARPTRSDKSDLEFGDRNADRVVKGYVVHFLGLNRVVCLGRSSDRLLVLPSHPPAE